MHSSKATVKRTSSECWNQSACSAVSNSKARAWYSAETRKLVYIFLRLHIQLCTSMHEEKGPNVKSKQNKNKQKKKKAFPLNNMKLLKIRKRCYTEARLKYSQQRLQDALSMKTFLAQTYQRLISTSENAIIHIIPRSHARLCEYPPRGHNGTRLLSRFRLNL